MELKHAFFSQNWGSNALLIVPYGIETSTIWNAFSISTPLLIVPYGIETRNNYGSVRTSRAFNRTLWN